MEHWGPFATQHRRVYPDGYRDARRACSSPALLALFPEVPWAAGADKGGDRGGAPALALGTLILATERARGQLEARPVVTGEQRPNEAAWTPPPPSCRHCSFLPTARQSQPSWGGATRTAGPWGHGVWQVSHRTAIIPITLPGGPPVGPNVSVHRQESKLTREVRSPGLQTCKRQTQTFMP